MVKQCKIFFWLKNLKVFPIVNVAAVKCSLYSCSVNFKQLPHVAKLWHTMLLFSLKHFLLL